VRAAQHVSSKHTACSNIVITVSPPPPGKPPHTMTEPYHGMPPPYVHLLSLPAVGGRPTPPALTSAVVSGYATYVDERLNLFATGTNSLCMHGCDSPGALWMLHCQPLHGASMTLHVRQAMYIHLSGKAGYAACRNGCGNLTLAHTHQSMLHVYRSVLTHARYGTC
jgi:hypothetical protein